MKKGRMIFISGAIAGALAGFFFAAKLNLIPPVESQSRKPQAGAYSLEGFRMEDAVIKVAETTGKAVVSISSEHTAKGFDGNVYRFDNPFGGDDRDNPLGSDELFRKFFEDFFGGELPQREFKQYGLGSGVIIDKDGYILTNQHVVDEADKITVTLSDGREFKGEVKGQDPRSDLAVIKINAKDLPAARLGDSDGIKIGQWVVAIGNPFGYALQNTEPTVTAGVISALHRTLGRSLSRQKDYGDLIQTDAAINPGNSGGPLVNLKGEVVGINVAIFSTTGGYQGIGFAIPINTAKRVIDSLIAGKKVLYGWLGVTIQDLNDDLRQYFGLTGRNGVIVAKVLGASPADKAGIKEGDIILKFGREEISDVRQLVNIVGKAEVASRVEILLLRDKKQLSVSVEIGERPEDIDESDFKQPAASASSWRGIEAEEISPQAARRFRIEEERGVVITGIKDNSPADEAGLVPGDVIVSIEKQPVGSLSDYNNIIKSLKGDALIRVLRGYFLVKEESKE